MKKINIYFYLKFGLAFVTPNLSQIKFEHQKSLKEMFKTGDEQGQIMKSRVKIKTR